MLTRQVMETFPLETGGILMGYWSEPDVVITHATGPGPRAVHKTTGFLPDAEYQEQEVAFIYAESGRLSTYLGDWHSHPYGSTRLSWKDKRTLRRIAHAPEARCPQPLMAVMAGEEGQWGLGIWRLSKSGPLAFLLGRDLVFLKPRLYS
jgi:integrative and conjugative element protein (TIGR02256 family)